MLGERVDMDVWDWVIPRSGAWFRNVRGDMRADDEKHSSFARGTG
jgi:hypothetical protein